jgi:hypothetical protein
MRAKRDVATKQERNLLDQRLLTAAMQGWSTEKIRELIAAGREELDRRQVKRRRVA